MLKLTEKCKLLYDLIMKIPTDLDEIRTELENGGYSLDELAAVSHEFADTCFLESIDCFCDDNDEHYEFYNSPAVVIQNKHSTFFFEVIKLFLEHGMDPNTVVENDSILDVVRYIRNEYIAADTLALLFEHGADVNLQVNGSRVFHDIDFDILFDAFNQNDRRYYDSLVHCWFVWLGYGARLDNGESGLELFKEFNTGKEFDLAKLKNHRDYTFGLSHVACHNENWSLHIFEKQTLWEVARL